jgi:membrane protease YdiL (CAAX protease family)
VQRADLVVRGGLWLALVLLAADQLGGQLSGEPLLSLIVFAALMAGFLLASLPPVARGIHQLAETEPVSMALIPLFALVPYALYGQLEGSLETASLLIAGILLFLPTAAAFINTPQLKRGDVSLGLITVATPLVLPLTRSEAIDATQTVLRLAAFALPVLLLILTSREQKQRLNFLFMCAVLSLWYAVEFDAFPSFRLPYLAEGPEYFKLALLPIFLYVLAAAGRFDGLGLSFKPSARGLSIVASNLILAAAVIVPAGLISGYLVPGFSAPAPAEAALSFLAGYVFVALPEEALFRGVILHYLGDTLKLPVAAAVAVSALVFGAAHLNNPPDVGWYFALATAAGIFYARAYLETRNVAVSATLHAAVNWLWALAFAGGMR